MKRYQMNDNEKICIKEIQLTRWLKEVLSRKILKEKLVKKNLEIFIFSLEFLLVCKYVPDWQ
jgi:hypothetical protein